MAVIPASGIATEETTFRTNMLSTYNVFEAARLLGLHRVVWASSETILGLPFEREQPAYAPIDERHPPYPESRYAVSKLLAEELARQLNRWTGTPFVLLRLHDVREAQRLWGYVDARDVAQSCALALERDVSAEHFIIAAADTVMNRPSRELMAEVYREVPYRPTAGEYDSLLWSEKTRDHARLRAGAFVARPAGRLPVAGLPSDTRASAPRRS